MWQRSPSAYSFFYAVGGGQSRIISNVVERDTYGGIDGT